MINCLFSKAEEDAGLEWCGTVDDDGGNMKNQNINNGRESFFFFFHAPKVFSTVLVW